jgi:CubicO group peptidase (beta-lactamase class C family)
MRRAIRTLAGGLPALWLLVSTGGAACAAGTDILPEHLAALRLQGPVLIEGQTGWALESRMRELNVHGVSVAVCAEGEIRWAEAWGLADVETGARVTTGTLFQAGSISKPVAAAGVLHQVEAGALALDRPVNDYLRSWKLPDNELTQAQPVTLERILSHGAGLTVHGFPGYAVGEPVPTVPQVLDGGPPANTPAVRVDIEPGSRFRYSGGGYTVAQLVLTDIAGEPFPALLERTVLRPAGMADSTYQQPLPPTALQRAAAGYRRDGSEVPGKRHTYPEMAAAGLWATPSDLCRFAMAVQRSRSGGDGALLGRAMAERMTTPFTGEAGLGFFVDSRRGEVYFGHGGADEGFQALLTASRDHSVAAAVMVNSDNGIRLAEEIIRDVARREGWPGYLPEPLPVIPLGGDEAAALAGRYRIHADEAFELAAGGGGLELRTPQAEPVPLFQVAPGELARLDRETRYRVERDGGTVVAVEVVEPAGGDDPEQRVTARRMAEGERLPSDLLAAGDLEGAAAAYRRLHAEHPDDDSVSEQRLNNFGYQLAAQGQTAQALVVLGLNNELHPTSANTSASLAEITLASGDRDRALALYRKVLEVLPQDADASEAFKNQLRANAETKIRELGGNG